MEIKFNKTIPEHETYQIGIMGNNLVDELVFTLDNVQDNGILLNKFKPFLKMAESALKFAAYVDKDPDIKLISTLNGKLIFKYKIQKKTTAYSSLIMQLQFEDRAHPDTVVWQTETFTVTFSDTVNADDYVAPVNSCLLQNHEKRIKELEKYASGWNGLGDGAMSLIELTEEDYDLRKEIITADIPSSEEIQSDIFERFQQEGFPIWKDGREYMHIPFTMDQSKYRNIKIQYQINQSQEPKTLNMDLNTLSFRMHSVKGVNKIIMECSGYISSFNTTVKLTVFRKFKPAAFGGEDSPSKCDWYLFETQGLQGNNLYLYSLTIQSESCSETVPVGIKMSIGLKEHIPVTHLDEIKADYNIRLDIPENGVIDEEDLNFNASLKPMALSNKAGEGFCTNTIYWIDEYQVKMKTIPFIYKAAFNIIDGIPLLSTEFFPSIEDNILELELADVTVTRVRLYKLA